MKEVLIMRGVYYARWCNFSWTCVFLMVLFLILMFLLLLFAAVLLQIPHAGENLAKYYAYFGFCVGDACGI